MSWIERCGDDAIEVTFTNAEILHRLLEQATERKKWGLAFADTDIPYMHEERPRRLAEPDDPYWHDRALLRGEGLHVTIVARADGTPRVEVRDNGGHRIRVPRAPRAPQTPPRRVGTFAPADTDTQVGELRRLRVSYANDLESTAPQSCRRQRLAVWSLLDPEGSHKKLRKLGDCQSAQWTESRPHWGVLRDVLHQRAELTREDLLTSLYGAIVAVREIDLPFDEQEDRRTSKARTALAKDVRARLVRKYESEAIAADAIRDPAARRKTLLKKIYEYAFQDGDDNEIRGHVVLGDLLPLARDPKRSKLRPGARHPEKSAEARRRLMDFFIPLVGSEHMADKLTADVFVWFLGRPLKQGTVRRQRHRGTRPRRPQPPPSPQ